MKEKMKTLKTLSTILLMSAIWSCGTRSIDKNKSVQKNEENTEQKSEVKKESESKETSQISTENNSESKASANEKIFEKQQENQSKTESKTDSQISQTKYSNIEYFENGGIKSKTEYSAHQPKLSQENTELKQENEYYYSAILAKQEENKIISVQNSFLKQIKKEKSDSIGNLKKQIENFSKNTSNKTERKAYPVWVWILLGIIIGKFGWDILNFFWNKIKASQWWMQLISKLKNK